MNQCFVYGKRFSLEIVRKRARWVHSRVIPSEGRPAKVYSDMTTMTTTATAIIDSVMSVRMMVTKIKFEPNPPTLGDKYCIFLKYQPGSVKNGQNENIKYTTGLYTIYIVLEFIVLAKKFITLHQFQTSHLTFTMYIAHFNCRISKPKTGVGQIWPMLQGHDGFNPCLLLLTIVIVTETFQCEDSHWPMTTHLSATLLLPSATLPLTTIHLFCQCACLQRPKLSKIKTNKN